MYNIHCIFYILCDYMLKIKVDFDRMNLFVLYEEIIKDS